MQPEFGKRSLRGGAIPLHAIFIKALLAAAGRKKAPLPYTDIGAL